MISPVLIVASHGSLAKSALESAVQIFGEIEGSAAIGLDPDGRLEDIEKEIIEITNKLGKERPVLLLVDLFGGSCSNVAAKLLKLRKDGDSPIRIVAGFNLAMLIEYAFSKDKYEFEPLANRILEAGRKACLDVNAKFQGLQR